MAVAKLLDKIRFLHTERTDNTAAQRSVKITEKFRPLRLRSVRVQKISNLDFATAME